MNLLTVLHHFSAIIALFTLIIGVFAIVKPKAMADNYGVPALPATFPYVMATGLRDVYTAAHKFVEMFA